MLKSYLVEDLHIDTIGGNKCGQWRLNLTWSGVINCNSRVFVSCSEFNRANGCAFIGAVRYTVHNVSPYNDSVNVWVEISWDSDIPIRLDYSIINP